MGNAATAAAVGKAVLNSRALYRFDSSWFCKEFVLRTVGIRNGPPVYKKLHALLEEKCLTTRERCAKGEIPFEWLFENILADYPAMRNGKQHDQFYGEFVTFWNKALQPNKALIKTMRRSKVPVMVYIDDDPIHLGKVQTLKLFRKNGSSQHAWSFSKNVTSYLKELAEKDHASLESYVYIGVSPEQTNTVQKMGIRTILHPPGSKTRILIQELSTLGVL